MVLAFFMRIVPQSIKNIYHLSGAVLAGAVFGFPGRKLRIIGVTGTDGKTTTVQCIAAILRESGKKVALASTINFRIGEREWVNASKFTTLSGWKVQKFLREAVSAGCEYAVLEVSSHALDQGRVYGVPFEVAVITNITREHLDYHGTMKEYRRAKRRLFNRAKIGVVNLDMEDSAEFLETPPMKHVTYSRVDAAADVLAENIVVTLEGSTFRVGETDFHLMLPGLFNVENALAALAATVSCGISYRVAARALSGVRGVPGRMERVDNERGITLLIDYAVTPNALENLYRLISNMRASSATRIIAVFGACGDRDRGKRPIMGEIVSSYADIVILTNEDPYTEDPKRIINEIQAGIANKTLEETLFIIMERQKAIAKAIELAMPGDVIAVTGKGAEETMAIGSRRILWNDKRVIGEILREMSDNVE
ncbi:MAG: UDP-N-acetylmuramoyl-L-alanyl-D-glutamate--2,6-diaminopimelate ligase [Candidatus Moraniibacteriota bacterium]